MAHEASTLASHPQFIALAYQLIENAIKNSKIPSYTCGVIGGGASILYLYHHMGRDLTKTIKSLKKNTRTTDIDIALWYHSLVKEDDFLESNQRIKKNIEKKFSGPFLEEWKEIIEGILGKKLTRITCEMEEMGRYAKMTGKINICFTIDGHKIELIEMVIHNHYYSQDRNPDFTVRTGPTAVTSDVTYLDKNNTEFIQVILFVDEDKTYYVDVRVPKVDRLLLQLYFVYGNKLLDGKLVENGSDDKYYGRINYLLRYGTKKILHDMEQHLRAEVSNRNAMTRGLTHSIRPMHGLPPLPPKKGGSKRLKRFKRSMTRKHYTR